MSSADSGTGTLDRPWRTSSYDELSEFLSSSSLIRPDVRLATLNLAEHIFSTSEGQVFLLADNCRRLSELVLLFSSFDNLEENWKKALKHQLYKVLINPSADSFRICKELVGMNDFIHDLMNLDVFEDSAAVKLASNLTLNKENCAKICEYVGNMRTFLASVAKRFLDRNTDTEIADYLGYVLRNLTQLKVIRELLIDVDSQTCSSLLSQAGSVLKSAKGNSEISQSKREVVADIFRNCCLDSDLHERFLDREDNLVAILYPLIGAEELSVEETDALPLDLQYMELTKLREPNFMIRAKLLEALFQISSTSVGRIYLRNHGTYAVLRTYHLWEKEEKLKQLCENVVGLLIRTEDEIGCDNLHNFQ